MKLYDSGFHQRGVNRTNISQDNIQISLLDDGWRKHGFGREANRGVMRQPGTQGSETPAGNGDFWLLPCHQHDYVTVWQLLFFLIIPP